MTSLQLRECTGLSNAELTCWINQGLVVPERIGAGGRNQEFRPDQLERVRVLRALHLKGVPLSRLARVRLDLDGRFVIFDGDGEDLQTCRDAAAAIAAVVRAKRWCSAIDLSVIRMGTAE